MYKNNKYIEYNGYIINPKPYPTKGGFLTRIFILKHYSNKTLNRKFVGKGKVIFQNRKQALLGCIICGMKIIEGKMPNCTVEDL